MTKELKNIFVVLFAMLSVTGCGPIGQKATNMAVIYGFLVALSVVLLCIYCIVIKEKNLWMITLYTSITVVEIGYFTLSMSETLKEALLSNRMAYLGSVFLPMTMLMMIFAVCKISYKKWMPFVLMAIGIVVFAIAASPGYLDVYYKDVTLKRVNGVAVLDKTYGPLHSIYLYYLIIYFTAMIISVVYACVKKLDSTIQAVILTGAVSVNLGVWLLEQLVKIDFEILSVSYIVSEFFLLALSAIVQGEQKVEIQDGVESVEVNVSIQQDVEDVIEEDKEVITADSEISERINELTPTERKVFDMYVSNKTSADIMEELHITNNTLKFHNKNIYSKLNINSRKQLVEIGKEYNNCKQNRDK